ncbi:MAG: hypothetical protein EHM49_04810, partial [Deltaproteobacteria bacterium]
MDQDIINEITGSTTLSPERQAQLVLKAGGTADDLNQISGFGTRLSQSARLGYLAGAKEDSMLSQLQKLMMAQAAPQRQLRIARGNASRNLGLGSYANIPNEVEAGGFSDNTPIYEFADGGMIPGRGSGDKVPVLAEPGEYVVPKKVVQWKGLEFFHKLSQKVDEDRSGTPKPEKQGGMMKMQYGGMVPGVGSFRLSDSLSEEALKRMQKIREMAQLGNQYRLSNNGTVQPSYSLGTTTPVQSQLQSIPYDTTTPALDREKVMDQYRQPEVPLSGLSDFGGTIQNSQGLRAYSNQGQVTPYLTNADIAQTEGMWSENPDEVRLSNALQSPQGSLQRQEMLERIASEKLGITPQQEPINIFYGHRQGEIPSRLAQTIGFPEGSTLPEVLAVGKLPTMKENRVGTQTDNAIANELFGRDYGDLTQEEMQGV